MGFCLSLGAGESENYMCEYCNDTGVVEVMGDGDNFEWDVVDTIKCKCQN